MKKRFFLLVVLFPLFNILCFAQEKITVNFKDADLRAVLESIAAKAHVNIVASPEVEGTVNARLNNVDWQTALEVILQAYDYGYAKYKDVIIVAPMDKIKARESAEKERENIEPVQIKVFRVKYIDGSDAKRLIKPLLSARGNATVLELTGQAGWEFGTDVTKRRRVQEGRISKTKVLVVSDIARKLDEVQALLEKVDVKPKQILIKAKIMEVNYDKLKDFGLDWGTGSTGASSDALSFLGVSSGKEAAVHALTGQATPTAFTPKEGTTMNIANTGLKFAFRKLTGDQFEAILHALEEHVHANTLSAPVILTLDNQEATILVGTKFPIVKTEVSQETGGIVGGSLDRYQDIGIQLNVVPQVCGAKENYINMIIHPAITSYTQTTKIQTSDGTTLSEYPIITSREAETQVLMKDGGTIVIGGLLKDIKTKERIGIPIFNKIPIIGTLFSRYTDDLEKVELLVFVTAKIVNPGEEFPEGFLDVDRISAKFKRKK